LPVRAQRNMENLVKHVVSETSVLEKSLPMESERPVNEIITHELLVLASDVVTARQSTSLAFPQSGRGNLKLLAHVVARAVGGWLDDDCGGDQAIALKVGKRLDTQVRAVRAALDEIADAARQVRSREMHRAHAASDIGEVLALPAALVAAEQETANKYHLQQTEIYCGFHELMRRNVEPIIVAAAPTPNADRREEQERQQRLEAKEQLYQEQLDEWDKGYDQGYATGKKLGCLTTRAEMLAWCPRCATYREEQERLLVEIKPVDRLRCENESLKEQCAELKASEKAGLVIENDLRDRVAQLEQELYWSKGREDALRDLLRDNFVLKPAAPDRRAAMTAAYERIPKYGSTGEWK
jgi:hypothetical protein